VDSALERVARLGNFAQNSLRRELRSLDSAELWYEFEFLEAGTADSVEVQRSLENEF
jgi:hypothetical protein